MMEGDHALEGGQRTFTKSRGLKARPTAILCSNDMTAIGVMRESYGKKIPISSERSLIGFDNIHISQYILPPLTTIEMSQAQLGRLAFQALLTDVRRELPNPKGTEYVLKTSFVLRDRSIHRSACPERGLWSRAFDVKSGSRSLWLPISIAGGVSVFPTTKMLRNAKRGLISAFACAMTFGGLLAHAQTRDTFHPDRMDTVLYGVAYYPEYMPYDRLDQDVQLMQKAGITVVRIGESSWGLWEPQDGKFEFDWMDRVVDKLHAAGIRIIMGTPTYSIPAWMY